MEHITIGMRTKEVFSKCFTAYLRHRLEMRSRELDEILAAQMNQISEFEGIINTGIAVINNLSAEIESDSSLIAKYHFIKGNNIDKIQAIKDIFERTKQNYQNIANQLAYI